jgi:biopolymer transport protein ExbB
MTDLIFKGGWVMVPILLGSVAALALVLERVWFFWSLKMDTAAFTSRFFSLVRAGELKEALEFSGSNRHPLAVMFRVGVEHAGEDAAEIERKIEREGARQIHRLEKNLNILAVVIGVEPLLGFLGTIIGLIRAFMTWEKFSTSVTVSTLAGGIYQAMITTAAGLIIAIPYFVIYHLFLGKVTSVSDELNHYGVSLLRKSKRVL